MQKPVFTTRQSWPGRETRRYRKSNWHLPRLAKDRTMCQSSQLPLAHPAQRSCRPPASQPRPAPEPVADAAARAAASADPSAEAPQPVAGEPRLAQQDAAPRPGAAPAPLLGDPQRQAAAPEAEAEGTEVATPAQTPEDLEAAGRPASSGAAGPNPQPRAFRRRPPAPGPPREDDPPRSVEGQAPRAPGPSVLSV